MANPIELLKREKHGFDVWPDVLRHATAQTPLREIPTPDLERMKWYGVFYRKRDTPGSYMLRIRITANELTASQAKEIARIACDLGYGIVDITTRANIQVQGLDIAGVPRALERLAAVGLTCKQTGLDNVRNVFGHPLSGVDPGELVDTRPLCRAITDIFLDHRDYADLPRKFNIALCGHAEHAIHFWTQDLSFLAVRIGERVGFRVAVAGKQGQMPQLGRPLPVFVPPESVPRVTAAFLDVFRAQGSREKRDSSRFHFLIEKIGIANLLEEVERRLGAPLERCDEEVAPPSGYDDLVGWYRQKTDESCLPRADGWGQETDIHVTPSPNPLPTGEGCVRWAVALRPPLGRMSWMQLEGIGLAAERWAAGRLRTTPEQGLVVLDVPTGFRDAIATQLARWNLTVHADSRVRSVMACTGKQFCNIAVTETKAHALQLIERLRQRSLELHGIHIHMSGCPSSCANHHTADIGLKGVRVKRLLGTREGFDVLLGGGVAGKLHLAMPYRMGVDVDQLHNLIDEVVREYYLRHSPGETFSDFWRNELLRRQPSSAKEHEYQPPVWECENCRHCHLGEDPPVYCPQCAALRRHFARLDQSAESSRDSETPAAESLSRVGGYNVVVDATAVPNDRGLLVQVGGHELALFRKGDQIHAIDNACPHAGGSLAEGAIDDGCVTCPLHGWKFDVATGAGVVPTRGRVASYPTKIEDGKVLVKLGGREA
jgi:sulfite reductase beta subunit-like hemoprotein/nitrite reductase/ring-hydroxylating ferredoxin subunit